MKKALSILFILVALVVLVAYIGRGGEKGLSVDEDQNSDEVSLMTDSDITTLVGDFEFDNDASTINWEGSKTLIEGYSDSGSINISKGIISFSEGAVSSVDVTVDMNSLVALKTGVGAGMDKLTEHLKSADFFDVATYSEAKFVSTGEALIENGTGKVSGNLTIKGITQPVEIIFTISGTPDRMVFSGETTFDRTLFGANFNSGKFFQDLGDSIISDEVKLSFDLVAR